MSVLLGSLGRRRYLRMIDLHECALALLARREHSKLELKRKLIARGYSNSEIEAELASLAKDGLQSDERFAETYVRQRIKVGFGPRRITLELQQRGVVDPLIHIYLPRDKQFWWSRLAIVWQRKYHTDQDLDEKAYAKQARFLVQRGFDPEQVYRWMEKIIAETHE